MSLRTEIVWTDASLNVVTGCTKASPGCLNCYAERMSNRLKLMGQARYANGFEVTVHPEVLEEPLRRRKPTVWFVPSMGDLFHDEVPEDFIHDVFDMMRSTPQHLYQVLTKRPERMASFAAGIMWPANVMAGTSIETDKYVYRADILRRIDAPGRRFLSCEPLLDSLPSLDLDGIDWVIVGGESGPGARPIEAEWVRDIRDKCVREGVSFMFKQWGGTNKKKTGRELDGRIWDERPEIMRLHAAGGAL